MGKYFFVLIAWVAVFSACNRNSASEKGEVLPIKTFTEVLTDIHIAEGVISVSKTEPKIKKDSVSVYNYVLKKHDISRADFSETVKYYSIHSDEYNILYDSLIQFFTDLELKLREEFKIEQEKEDEERKRKKDTLNLWNLKYEWELPEDGLKTPIPFNIEVNQHGTYSLAATIRLFRDDKSVNQRMTIIANYSDGTRDLNSAGSMVKDGKFERYEVRVTTDTTKVLKSVSGWLLDHSRGTEKKHVSVKDIELKLVKEEYTK